MVQGSMAVIKYLMFFFNFLFWVSWIITTCILLGMDLDSPSHQFIMVSFSLLETNGIITFLTIYHMFTRVSAKESENLRMSESFHFAKRALTNCRLKSGFTKISYVMYERFGAFLFFVCGKYVYKNSGNNILIKHPNQ